MYRTQADVPKDPVHKPSFWQRWRQTCLLSGGYFIVGFPFQLMTLTWWSLVWLTCGLLLTGIGMWAERKWFYPARLRQQERVEWLRNLPRSPDGRHYYIDQAGWEKHFGSGV